jgi:hypothetical protein
MRKRIKKIYTKIDLIAKKGHANVFEYYKYIDEIITNGEYGLFEQTLFYYYNIDVVDSIDVDFVKKSTWKPILFQTNSTLATNLKKTYDSKNVYQIGLNFFTSYGTSSVLIGQIQEVDGFTQDAKYYYENNEFAKLIGQRTIFLNATKSYAGAPIYPFNNPDDPTLSSDQNLLIRYIAAIDYLLNNDG